MRELVTPLGGGRGVVVNHPLQPICGRCMLLSFTFTIAKTHFNHTAYDVMYDLDKNIFCSLSIVGIKSVYPKIKIWIIYFISKRTYFRYLYIKSDFAAIGTSLVFKGEQNIDCPQLPSIINVALNKKYLLIPNKFFWF